MHFAWLIGLMIFDVFFEQRVLSSPDKFDSENDINSNLTLDLYKNSSKDLSSPTKMSDLLQVSFSEQLFQEALNNSFRNKRNNITVQMGATVFLHCHLKVPQSIKISQILLTPAENCSIKIEIKTRNNVIIMVPFPTTSFDLFKTHDQLFVGKEIFLELEMATCLESRQQATWIRKRNWHILASGTGMYTSDDRYRVIHPEGSTDWILEIRYVQSRDNGSYICQIATKYGILYRQIHLHVVVSQAVIQGLSSTAEYHIDIGSEISLLCVIEHSSTSTPHYIFWYHNDRMINYDQSRGGITVETKSDSKQTGSQLTIRNAHIGDSGNYTCSASNAVPASIYVFVSEGCFKVHL